MNDLIHTMTSQAIDKVRAAETFMRALPQSPVHTDHVLHAGIYTRTVMLPANAVTAGALIKVPTILVLCGDCTVFMGDQIVRAQGYHVIAASAGRKQAFAVHEDTFLSMSFKTDAKTVEEAEHEFTDEVDQLLSRAYPAHNTIRVSGE